DRPNVGARGDIEVFEAHRVLARHDEKMALRDGVQVHKSHDGLVLVHHAGLGLIGRDCAEDALLSWRRRVLCHARNAARAYREVLLSLMSEPASASRSA